MRIVVASTNPVKIECARKAFSQVFPDEQIEVIGVNGHSGVSDQPMSGEETLLGANNRTTNAMEVYPNGDYWVGIEGGAEYAGDELLVFAWIVVQSKVTYGRAKTATFVLPDEVATLVKQGIELGDADDLVFDRKNSKQQNGSVGILTRDLIDRADYYTPAVILALIPQMNPELTFSKNPVKI